MHKEAIDFSGYLGQLVGQPSRTARIALFYRNELWEYLLAEKRKSDRPLTSRKLAYASAKSRKKTGETGAL